MRLYCRCITTVVYTESSGLRITFETRELGPKKVFGPDGRVQTHPLFIPVHISL
ncbi:hypothetical protein EXN66_Car008598 [Channa argus]|uniref:Uncharacterized protein n=1 Tax=Channa argus TaxID=215402 RepID=A0A6G1PRM4_CHAAH|nr:hypothetical protein EXN66_Car008598 [Channa argus]